MEQPQGFIDKDKENLICRFKKNLYGLKQVTRQWYKKFDFFIIDHGYNRTTSDHYVFVKRSNDDDFIIILLYVDDMLIVGHDIKRIQSFKVELSKFFIMKDLG